MKFAFIAAEKASFPVRVLCRTLEVSRAGFYAWHTRPPAARTLADQRFGMEIQAIHAESRQRCTNVSRVSRATARRARVRSRSLGAR